MNTKFAGVADDSAASPLRRGAKKSKKQEVNSKTVIKSRFQEEFMIEIEDREGIVDEGDLEDIKFLLTTNVGQTFNTNIMRIALNLQEEKIASIVLAEYDSKIDDEMVLRAVKTKQLGFL